MHQKLYIGGVYKSTCNNKHVVLRHIRYAVVWQPFNVCSNIVSTYPSPWHSAEGRNTNRGQRKAKPACTPISTSTTHSSTRLPFGRGTKPPQYTSCPTASCINPTSENEVQSAASRNNSSLKTACSHQVCSKHEPIAPTL